MAETALVAASQWWLQERLLAVEMRVLGASKDVGQLAEETTREAYRLADEARVRVEELASGVAQEARKVRPLYPQCANNKEVRQIVEEIYNCKSFEYHQSLVVFSVNTPNRDSFDQPTDQTVLMNNKARFITPHGACQTTL